MTQSGTLWYLRIIFRNITIFSSITKNGAYFVPRMEMPVSKMAMVTFKLLCFQVEWINSDYQIPILDWMLVATIDSGNNCSTFIFWVQDTEMQSLRHCTAISIFANAVS